jgi:CheY-like chemotaxis protein
MVTTDHSNTETTTAEVGKPHVLVVNDTQEILDLFQEILEGEGFRVSLSAFAIKNLDTIIELAPDLVILDFLMGGEQAGWQLLQKMKMDRRTADIPVVVCTAALSMVRDLEGHLRSKNVGVVLKPFDIDDLMGEVTTALQATSDTPEPGT